MTEEECEGLVTDDGSVGREVGMVMAGSYVNYYLCNGAVIVPQFGGESSERDAVAVNIIREQFPDRQVIPFSSRVILCGGGNIHCVTMQQP
jgi:agmatine deiminase